MGLENRSSRWGYGLAVAGLFLSTATIACGGAPVAEIQQEPQKSPPKSEPLIVDKPVSQGKAGWRYRFTQYGPHIVEIWAMYYPNKLEGLVELAGRCEVKSVASDGSDYNVWIVVTEEQECVSQFEEAQPRHALP